MAEIARRPRIKTINNKTRFASNSVNPLPFCPTIFTGWMLGAIFTRETGASFLRERREDAKAESRFPLAGVL